MEPSEKEKLIAVLFLYSFGRWIADKSKDIDCQKELEFFKKSFSAFGALSESELIDIIEQEKTSEYDSDVIFISSEVRINLFVEYPFVFILSMKLMINQGFGYIKTNTYTLSKDNRSITIRSSLAENLKSSLIFHTLISEIDEVIDFKHLVNNYDSDKKYNFDEDLFSDLITKVQVWSARSLRMMVTDLLK
jgi:hypothetical protein